MESTVNPTSTVPITPPALTRRLAVGTLAANAAVAIIAAGVVAYRGRAGEWTAFGVSTAVGLIGAIVSVAVLSAAAGRTVDWLVTFVMGASAVRLFVSLIGVLVAVQGVKTAAGMSAVLICSFFVATLVAESVLLGRTVREPVGGKHA